MRPLRESEEKMSSELNREIPHSGPTGIEKVEPLISIRNLTVHFDAGRERAREARATNGTERKKAVATIWFLRLVLVAIAALAFVVIVFAGGKLTWGMIGLITAVLMAVLLITYVMFGRGGTRQTVKAVDGV